MKRKLMVWDKTYEVAVYQKSKSVWMAVGEYTELLAVPGNTTRTISVTGRTESAAIKSWAETARYWGN